jgi:23S rRNA (guanosine2251-2'-O)-methyltransferase
VSLLELTAGREEDLWSLDIPSRAAFVLGNETAGVSAAVASRCVSRCSVPLAGGVESLNVASAAAVVAFEIARRRSVRPA